MSRGARSRQVVRGGLLIVAATLAGQLLGLVALPIISRSYSPAELGLFSVVMALALLLGTVASGRLEMAIPLPSQEAEATSLAVFAAVAASLTCALVLAIMGALSLTPLFDGGSVWTSPWLTVVPICAWLYSLYLTLNQLAIRHQRYGLVGMRNLANGGGTALAQSGFGVMGLGIAGLVVGYLIGLMLGVVTMLGGGRRQASAARSGARFSTLLARYRHFPIYMGPSALINVAGLQLPVLLVATLYSSTEAGYVGMTFRILAVPITLIGTAIAQVYLGEVARGIRGAEDQTHRLFRKVSWALCGASVVTGVVILLFGPDMFGWVLGAEWRPSGAYAQALAPSMAAQFVAAPLGQTLVVLERQNYQLGWDVVRLVMTTVTIVGGAMLGWSPLTVMWAFGVVSALCYSALWALSLKAVTDHRNRTRATLG